MEETTQYGTQWSGEAGGATPGEYVQKLAALSEAMGLENQLMYFKTVDEDGNKQSHEGSESDGLEQIAEDAVIDNLRVEYRDDDRRVVLEYDSGALGDPYRLQVNGDTDFKEEVEDAVDRELSGPTSHQVREKMSAFTDRVTEYLDDRSDD